MKRLIQTLFVVLTISLFSTFSVAGKTRNPSEFLIASVDTNLTYCFTSFTDSLQFEFGVRDGPTIPVGSVEYVLIRQFNEDDEGETLWWTEADVNFDIVSSFLTDGKPNLTNRVILGPNTGQGWGTGYSLETGLFGEQVGSNGVDLGGYKIRRIGLRLNNVQLWDITSGTCYAVESTMLFTQEATLGGCKYGGWENLKRINETSFKNQGACIRYANTGQ